jgi:Group II intron, maturase-specific domain
MFNANIRGWINYYGRYYKSALYPTLSGLVFKLATHQKWTGASLAEARGTGPGRKEHPI